MHPGEGLSRRRLLPFPEAALGFVCCAVAWVYLWLWVWFYLWLWVGCLLNALGSLPNALLFF